MMSDFDEPSDPMSIIVHLLTEIDALKMENELIRNRYAATPPDPLGSDGSQCPESPSCATDTDEA